MGEKQNYPIVTGEHDRQRLKIINKIYNSATCLFLQQSGLKAGMKILEIGCGTGEIACWLAKQVTPAGKVIAIDNSAEQLAIAEQTAKKAGVMNNIEFIQFDIRNLGQLKEKFDFIYGRAVVEFLIEGHKSVFKELYSLLNSSGILTYESVSAVENGHFSYPHQPVMDDYFSINKQYFLASRMTADLPSKLYLWFREFGCSDVVIKTNQPVLINSEDKSVVRLGAISARHTVYEKYSESEYQNFIQQLHDIEQDDEIILGFFRSLLIKGVKL